MFNKIKAQRKQKELFQQISPENPVKAALAAMEVLDRYRGVLDYIQTAFPVDGCSAKSAGRAAFIQVLTTAAITGNVYVEVIDSLLNLPVQTVWEILVWTVCSGQHKVLIPKITERIESGDYSAIGPVVFDFLANVHYDFDLEEMARIQENERPEDMAGLYLSFARMVEVSGEDLLKALESAVEDDDQEPEIIEVKLTMDDLPDGWSAADLFRYLGAETKDSNV